MKYILFFVLFLLPIFAQAEVIISEISWMGNSSSANAEWIELQNTGGSSVNLSGWTLKAEDGTPSINLSGSISAGAYALLERSSDATVPGVSALVIYTGALGNDGEHLVLRDGNGNIIQNLNFSSGWPAGNNTTKETMQWNGSIWITAEPTPGAVNATFDSGSTGNQGTGIGTQQDADNEDSNSGSSSASSVITGKKEEKIRYDRELIEIKAVNTNIPVGTPVKISLFTRDLDGSNIVRGNFFWNMGDGTEFILNKNEKFEHVYEHEGSYVITVRYHSSYFEGIEPNATSRLTINVTSSGVVVSAIHFDGGIELRNTTGLEIDLTNWSLNDTSGKKFTIPYGTYILPGKTIVFNPKQTGINSQSAILLNPIGKFVSSKEKFPSSNPAQNVQASRSTSVSTTRSSNSSAPKLNRNETDNKTVNLNERLTANTSSAPKQKQSSVWIIVFVIMLTGVCVLVFFLYKKEESREDDETKEEDEFELID